MSNERADDDATLAPFRDRSDRATPKTVIPNVQSGQIADARDVQLETQRADGGPYLPTTIHERVAAGERQTPQFNRKFFPPNWRD